MLGLCFLILDKIECEEIWEDWIRGNEDRVSITIHSKVPYIPRTDIFRQKAKCIPTIPTRWGDFSLVQATVNLFEKSIQNPVTHCILLSGACIPLKPFSVVYETLESNIGKSFVSNMLPVSDSRYIRANIRIKQQLPDRNIECKKHHQWIIACKHHVECILNNYELITAIYQHTKFSDEAWFLTILEIRGLESEVIYRQTTYTDWTNGGCHPKTHLEISDELIQNPEYLFGRKFTSSLRKYNLNVSPVT